MRAPGRLIVEIEAVRHDAVSKRGRLRRRFTAEPENGSFRSPACIQDNVGHAAYRGLHATAGERYTDDVENGFLGRFDCFLRQVFEPGICNVVGETWQRSPAGVMDCESACSEGLCAFM